MFITKLTICVLVILVSISGSSARNLEFNTNGYDRMRTVIQRTEDGFTTGGRIKLSPKELRANRILMSIKNEEIAEGLKNPDMYPPGMHFFKAKPLIRQSHIFKIIQKMPKGAFLHGHNTGMVSSRWVIKNLTYQHNVMTCEDERGVLLLTLRNNTKCVTPLTSIRIERLKAKDQNQYDRQLEEHINLYNKQPEADVGEPHKIWKRFEDIFDTVNDLYKYAPVFRTYHHRMLEELYEDNVLYAEIRSPLSSVYEANQTYSTLEVAEELEEVVNNFKKTHPDFLGMKLIFAKRNKGTKEQMAKYVHEFNDIYRQKPNFVIGFDLIGNEDIGDPLHKFLDEFSELPRNASYFFHAGETKWYGKTDWNLLDAILLNTKRIGHGYALPKHPQLWETVKSKGIGLEISPISNQVLGLVWDLRNHPASYFLAADMPVVISADDPGMWNSRGLSYDFYYAFMSLASTDADLRTLKQLVLNSIKLSVLTNEERQELRSIFHRRWEKFLDFLIQYNPKRINN